MRPRHKCCRKMEGLLLSGSKLVAIPPGFVAQRIKLDLAKHFRVLLCRSYEPEASIILVVGCGRVLFS